MKAGLSTLTKFADTVNIAEELDEQLLLDIGQRVCEDFDTDDASRSDWLKRNEKAIKIASQVVEEKSWPWENASNVHYPLVTSAAVHFNARCYPAIISGSSVVKGKVVGNDETGEKADRAERVGEHMSYQLLDEMPEWEEETDKLTTILPIVGMVFRKTYFCPIRQRNVSKLVRAENFVFHYDYTFDMAPRYTEIIPNVYPQQITEYQRMGLWLEENLGIADDDEEEGQEFLEQHRLIDLDEDGYKEPYIVTVHHDSQKVVRIVSCYDIDDITVKYDGEVATVKEFRNRIKQAHAERMTAMNNYEMIAQGYVTQGIAPPPMPPLGPLPTFEESKAKVAKIDKIQYYTKYGFIPAFDGSGYDVGLGMLLGPLGEAVNTNLNQMIDAGTLSNLQGGFISRGLKIRKGKARTAPNEWITVDNTAGGSIRDSIVPFAHKGPSPILFTLLSFLIDAARDISSVKDTITGETAGANESPTTYLARVDEGLKVFSAIYKRIHRSLKQEYKKLFRLNRLYMPDEQYFTVLDNPKAIKRADYAAEGVDIIPVSDPSMATTVQKNAKIQAVYQVAKGNPRYNQYENEKRFLEALDVPHEGFLLKDEELPPPPPDYNMVEMQSKVEKTGAETEKIKAETAKTLNDIEAKMLELNQKYELSLMDFSKAIEELDIKRIGKQLDYLSKVVTQKENLQIHERLKDEERGILGGPAIGGGVPSMEGESVNIEGALSSPGGTEGTQ